MADEMDLKQAQSVFNTLCQALDAKQWHYQKNEEELKIECGVQGEDLPIRLTIKVDAKRRLVMLFSHIPFVIPEDKRLDLAVAISIVNNRLVDGCFDYNLQNGHIFFRMTNSYIDSTVGDDVFTYMIYCSSQTIDAYNDKFLMISKGMMTLEQFLKAE